MTVSAAWRREWRQFRLLLGVSYRRLLDAALASRDMDAEQVALWGAALLATPPVYAAFIWTTRYPWLRARSLDALQSAAVADRLFFVTWSMLVALLVGALVWDGLFPDRTDQQVVGTLPVKSQTVAAARVTAALVTVVVLLAGVNLPAAIVYAVAGAVDPTLGTFVGIFAGQMLASVAAGTFAFSVFLTARGAIAWLAGASVASRIAVTLQFVAVVAVIEALMFLPGLLSVMVRQLFVHARDGTIALPPVWFLGLYAVFAGPHAAALTPMADTAVIALIAGLAAALALYVLPASPAARRAIEARQAEGTWRLVTVPLLTCRVLLRRPSARARYVFIVLSLVRNRRHLLVLATYLGIGVAIAGTRVGSAFLRGVVSVDQPADYLLVIPLTLTFCLVLGARAAFAAPTDGAANWAFRIVGPRTVMDSRSAARLAYMALAVWPVSGAALLAGTLLWGVGTGGAIAAMHAASGLVLCEVVLRGHEGVPFTKARALSTSSMKVGLAVAIGALHLFAFRLDDVQLWALGTWSRTAGYVVVAAAVAEGVALAGNRQSATEIATFDAPDDHAVTQLKLAEASL